VIGSSHRPLRAQNNKEKNTCAFSGIRKRDPSNTAATHGAVTVIVYTTRLRMPNSNDAATTSPKLQARFITELEAMIGIT
jgi:hypothetical protein